jgi:predicted permease
MFQDSRTAARALIRAPGFALVSILVLGLGIGLTTTLFTLVDRVFFKPLPFPNPKALVVIHRVNPQQGWHENPFSAPLFHRIRPQLNGFQGLAAFANRTWNLTGVKEPERVPGIRVTHDYLAVLGVQPFLGRNFNPEEDHPGGPGAVILGHAWWKTRFGGDPHVIGQVLTLDGEPRVVVGVLPPSLPLPLAGHQARVLVPMVFTSPELQAWGKGFLTVLGRLDHQASLAEPQREVPRVAELLERQLGNAPLAGWSARVASLQAEIVKAFRPKAIALLAAVGLLQVLVCLNVASLVLVRGLERQPDIVLRTALGAQRGQLVHCMLAECWLIGIGGGLLGLVLAASCLGPFERLLLLPIAGPSLDVRVLFIACLVSLATVLACGLLPALRLSSNVDLSSLLKDGARGSLAHGRLRNVIVAGKLALATCLLVLAGLAIQGERRMQRSDLGWNPTGVLTASLSIPATSYPSAEKRAALVTRLLDRVQEQPGVESAAFTDSLPLGGSHTSSTYHLQGLVPPVGTFFAADRIAISPAYVSTMGMLLREGRSLLPNERDACLVNERMARKHWPGVSPLGQRLSVNGSAGPWLAIVGVVSDGTQRSLGEEPTPRFYLPLAQNPVEIGSLLVRTRGNPMALAQGVKIAMREVDPALPISRTLGMEQLLARELAPFRVQAALFAGASALALGLASLGCFGVMSQTTLQRRGEWGLRMALGAHPASILWLVLRQGFGLAMVGLGLGWLLAVAMGFLLQHRFAGIHPMDPLSHLSTAPILALAVLLAGILPAWRASRIEPWSALRSP